LSDVYVAAKNNVHDIERDIDSPDAYIDNLRVLAALRLLREQPNYTIAVVAEEAGFANVRTLQRRIQDAIGMSPVDYRIMLTRDL
jgi:transcriptional regulator GlxA family with amidase domain